MCDVTLWRIMCNVTWWMCLVYSDLHCNMLGKSRWCLAQSWSNINLPTIGILVATFGPIVPAKWWILTDIWTKSFAHPHFCPTFLQWVLALWNNQTSENGAVRTSSAPWSVQWVVGLRTPLWIFMCCVLSLQFSRPRFFHVDYLTYVQS